MLKKPYSKILEKENNNYYFLQVNEIYYLAIESVLKYQTKTLFGTRDTELQQGLKLLPIYSPILLTMTGLVQQKATGKKTVEGLGEDIIYDTIDVKEIRLKIAELTKTVHEESKFDFNKAIKCESIKNIMKEQQLSLLMKQDIDTLTSIYWLAKSDKFGKLTIQEVTTFGRTEEVFISANTFVLTRDIVETLLVEYQRLQYEESKRILKMQKKELKRLVKEQRKVKEVKEEKE